MADSVGLREVHSFNETARGIVDKALSYQASGNYGEAASLYLNAIKYWELALKVQLTRDDMPLARDLLERIRSHLASTKRVAAETISKLEAEKKKEEEEKPGFFSWLTGGPKRKTRSQSLSENPPTSTKSFHPPTVTPSPSLRVEKRPSAPVPMPAVTRKTVVPVRATVSAPKRPVSLSTAGMRKPGPSTDGVSTQAADIARAIGEDAKYVENLMSTVGGGKESVNWDDIAGLKNAKDALEELVILPSRRPELFTGLRAPPKGMLMFGPPGNGKTMLAKVLASQAGCTFFSISASTLVSKWLGEGEKQVRVLFAIARYLQPSVVFIDEIDSILSARSSNEHEASRRLKTEFLIQLDGACTSSEDRILVMGATNRPGDLDEAVLRRMPKRIYIPLPDFEARLALIAHLMKDTPNSLNGRTLQQIAQATESFSGSDLAALCKEAAMGPIRDLGRSILDVKKEHVGKVSKEHFVEAMTRIRPSTSMDTIAMFERWNAEFGSSG